MHFLGTRLNKDLLIGLVTRPFFPYCLLSSDSTPILMLVLKWICKSSIAASVSACWLTIMGYKGKSLIFLAWQIWPNGFPPFREAVLGKKRVKLALLPWDFEKAMAFLLDSFLCFLKSHLHILLLSQIVCVSAQYVVLVCVRNKSSGKWLNLDGKKVEMMVETTFISSYKDLSSMLRSITIWQQCSNLANRTNKWISALWYLMHWLLSP